MAHQVHRFDDLTDGSWPAKFRTLTLTSALPMPALAMRSRWTRWTSVFFEEKWWTHGIMRCGKVPWIWSTKIGQNNVNDVLRVFVSSTLLGYIGMGGCLVCLLLANITLCVPINICVASGSKTKSKYLIIACRGFAMELFPLALHFSMSEFPRWLSIAKAGAIPLPRRHWIDQKASPSFNQQKMGRVFFAIPTRFLAIFHTFTMLQFA